MSENIQANVQAVREVIAGACARVNRAPESVTLVAVSKRKPLDDILAAHAAGVQHFGENRVEEMETKHLQVMEIGRASCRERG
jgi:PLP dependent protein